MINSSLPYQPILQDDTQQPGQNQPIQLDDTQQSDQTGQVASPIEPPVEGITLSEPEPAAKEWFFQRWRKQKLVTKPPPTEAASSAASSTSVSSSSSSTASSTVSQSSSSSSPSQPAGYGFRDRLYAWYTWFYSKPQGAASSSSATLPFDEGTILKEVDTVDKISKTIFVPDMNIIMRIADINAVPKTMLIDDKPVRWSKQFARDIPRMLNTGQLFIKGKQVENMLGLDDQKKVETIVRRIYKLTGGNEEMTYRITCLMCQNTPLFLYHSVSNQLYKKHHMIIMQGGEEDTTTQESYNLTRTIGCHPTERNIHLRVTTAGVLGMGIVEREGYGTLMIQQPATISAKEEINLTTGTARYTYTATLAKEALVQLQSEELETTPLSHEFDTESRDGSITDSSEASIESEGES